MRVFNIWKKHEWIFLAVFFSTSCESKHFSRKNIPVTNELIIEWYFVSGITSDQEFVGFKNTRSGKTSLIFKGGGICTVDLTQSKLSIFIDRGSYAEFDPQNNYGIEIVLDTTCKGEYLYKN